MRGENTEMGRVSRSAATIVDLKGVVKYHVIPNRLMFFGLASVGLLVLLALILAYMVLHNKWDIQKLNNKITVNETQNGEK